MSDETIRDITYQLMVGGFDTTASLLANALWYLDANRSEHSRLLDDDQFLRTATEEFVRWAAPVQALARTARVEMELGDQTIQPGDRMWMMYFSANRDSDVFDDPDEVRLDRFPNRHLGFGVGIHRCLGSNLARAVFQTVLRQVLRRMPDYTIDRTAARRFPVRAITNGWISQPATFTPGLIEDSGLGFSSSDLGLGR
jgi:cytochrome P450